MNTHEYESNRLQFWDSITTEDLEFSVGVKPNTWEVKDLSEADRRRSVY